MVRYYSERLLRLALDADQGPLALRSARDAMQQLDPNGVWDAAACRAEGLPLPRAGDILPVAKRWLAELDRACL